MTFKVTTVWEKQLRISYPISRFALSDNGVLKVATPRPQEPRTYNLVHLSLDGIAEIQSKISVETMLKLELNPDSDLAAGMTFNDYYFFKEGSKTRFKPEYVFITRDMASSLPGGNLVATFTDVSGESFSIAAGTSAGELLWIENLDFSPTAIAISGDGSLFALGYESGSVCFNDIQNRDLWRFGQEYPISSLSCSNTGFFTAYGTTSGSFGIIEVHGKRVTVGVVPGKIVDLSISGTPGCLAVIHQKPADASKATLSLIAGDGNVEWETTRDETYNGVSLSSSGRYLATSQHGGMVSLYQIENISMFAISQKGLWRETVQTAVQQNNYSQALKVLRDVLEHNSTDLDAAKMLDDLKATYFQKLTQDIGSHETFDEQIAQIEGLLVALKDLPENQELLAATVQHRDAVILKLLFLSDGTEDIKEKERLLRLAIHLDEGCMEARSRLLLLRQKLVDKEDDAAAACEAEGDLQGALSALARAQAVIYSNDRAANIERLEVKKLFVTGMAEYDSENYSEAASLFKRVISLQPNHVEATRYLNYAERFAIDASETKDTMKERFRFLE